MSQSIARFFGQVMQRPRRGWKPVWRASRADVGEEKRGGNTVSA